MSNKALLLPLFIALIFLNGCATRLNANVAPSQDMDNLGEIYVVRFEPDKRGLNQIIAEEFNALGYKAKYGESTDKPKSTQTVVTYSDKWMWDITMYMLSIDIQLFDVKQGMPIGNVHNFRTSLARKSPRGMIRGALYELLGKGTPPEDMPSTTQVQRD